MAKPIDRSKSNITNWMRENAHDYATPTELVEGAVVLFDLDAPKEMDPIWEWALDYVPVF
jgi:hypothetical protein